MIKILPQMKKRRSIGAGILTFILLIGIFQSAF